MEELKSSVAKLMSFMEELKSFMDSKNKRRSVFDETPFTILFFLIPYSITNFRVMVSPSALRLTK
jgi:hypothetical protein